jgi:hypothetical protein
LVGDLGPLPLRSYQILRRHASFGGGVLGEFRPRWHLQWRR